MKLFFDTNILVAAVLKQHVFHERSFAALDRVQAGKDDGFISAHSLAEMYSVLTSLPVPYRHTPEQALLSVEENVLKYIKPVALIGSEYATLIREAAKSQVRGGRVYDALLLKAAEKVGADRILTLNLKHFQSLASPELRSRLSEP
jgi:predicted nucleic acid-binding protein